MDHDHRTPPPAAPAGAGPARPSTTRRTLAGLTAGVGVLLVLAAALADLAFGRAHDAATFTQTRAVNAVLEVSAARRALVLADTALATNLAAPGRQVASDDTRRSATALASQNLAAAGRDTVAESGPGRLRVIDGLFVAYIGATAQAEANARAASLAGDDATPARRDGQVLLATAQLWDASRLVHDRGLLDELDRLQEDQLGALDAQLAEASSPALGWLAWLVPAAGAAAGLVVTQVYLSRRFRRRVNPLLLAATAGLVAGVGLLVLHLHGVHDDLRATQVDLTLLVRARHERSRLDANRGADALAEVLEARCGPALDGCGPTVANWAAARAGPGGPAPGEPAVDVDRAGGACRPAELARTVRRGADDVACTQQVIDRSDDAQARGASAAAVPVAAAGILLLTAGGLRPRLDQYRFRAP